MAQRSVMVVWNEGRKGWLLAFLIYMRRRDFPPENSIKSFSAPPVEVYLLSLPITILKAKPKGAVVAKVPKAGRGRGRGRSRPRGMEKGRGRGRGRAPSMPRRRQRRW